MLVWGTLTAGITICLIGVLAVVRTDRRWLRRHQQCCRCQDVWYGEGKLCDACGARGHVYDRAAQDQGGFPTHDWQGYLDTGPMPAVHDDGAELAGRSGPVDYSDPAWSAPLAR